MGSRSKRQQTIAKFAREQKVKDRRALKEEKKQAAAAARRAKATDSTLSADAGEHEALESEPGEEAHR
jgi:hypothetical protein